MNNKIKILILICCIAFISCNKKAYLFTSFHEPADAGLRMLYSYDGYHWKDFDTTFIKPEVGIQKVMRDPSIVQGPDGVFHFVWTSDWSGNNGFGYASSTDLIHWSKEEFIPVMKNEPTVVNVWAPELFYDDVTKQFIIIWASTVPFRFEKGIEDENNNHRLFYTTTKDFKTFTDSKLFYDPGFSSIDAEIIKRKKDDYVMVVKDNTRPERDIKVAFSNSALGSYSKASKPFTENFTEGPTVAKVKAGYLIYYDAYRNKKFGAEFTKDFKTFKNVNSLISIPEGHKHGTIFMVKKKILNNLLKATTKVK